jgi:hypothetical protein
VLWTGDAVRFERPLNLTDADARAFLSTLSLIVKTGRDVCDERLKPKILSAAFDPFRARLLVVSDQHAHVNGSVFAFDAVANGRFVAEAETAVELHPERFAALFGTLRRRFVVSRGWLDDQIKFAVGLREAFIRHPDSSWFVIVDDDTFVSGRSLAGVLASFDRTRPLVVGNSMVFDACGRGRFMHGGSGIALSSGAMRLFAPVVDACIVKFRACYAGDISLALCLRELGVAFVHFAGFQSQSPADAAATPLMPLCGEPVTFHRVSPEIHERLYQLELAERAQSGRFTLLAVKRALLGSGDSSVVCE